MNANAGTLNNVTINENCSIQKGKLVRQSEGDIVVRWEKVFPHDPRESEFKPCRQGTITVRIDDDQNMTDKLSFLLLRFVGRSTGRHPQTVNIIHPVVLL